jgi:serine/threonine protein phosphatase PrpC
MVDRPSPTPAFYVERDMDRVESHVVARIQVSIFTAPCPGKETPNEDAAVIVPYDDHSAVVAVADGLGGVRAGAHAASLAIRTLSASIEQGAQDDTLLRTAILNGLEAANGRVQSVGIGTATTLAVVEVVDDTVRPYHVGDSMILVVGQRGKIKLQTTSHSPVGFAVEAGLLDETEAMHHEDRHLVSNVIGSPEMTIEIGPSIRLAPRDTVLLASDGLFDNLYIQEVVERIRKGPLDKAVERLATDSRNRMLHPEPGNPSKPDDLTIVAFRRLLRPPRTDASLAAGSI